MLFDQGIFSVLTSGSAIGVGWKLAFYTGGTATPITTYNARTGGSANSNPVIAGAGGRFGQIWIEDSQTIKWVMTNENGDGTGLPTVDNFLLSSAPASFDTDLSTFLADASAAPLPIALGGTGQTSAANILVAIAALPLAGGTVTGNIIRSAKGTHPYYNSASMTGGQIYVQASGADPTSNPGDIVLEY